MRAVSKVEASGFSGLEDQSRKTRSGGIGPFTKLGNIKGNHLETITHSTFRNDKTLPNKHSQRVLYEAKENACVMSSIHFQSRSQQLALVFGLLLRLCERLN